MRYFGLHWYYRVGRGQHRVSPNTPPCTQGTCAYLYAQLNATPSTPWIQEEPWSAWWEREWRQVGQPVRVPYTGHGRALLAAQKGTPHACTRARQHRAAPAPLTPALATPARTTQPGGGCPRRTMIPHEVSAPRVSAFPRSACGGTAPPPPSTTTATGIYLRQRRLSVCQTKL